MSSGRLPSASPSSTGVTESCSTSGIYRPSLKSKTLICDLLFADDYALNVMNEQEMQQEIDAFLSAWYNFGLTISTKKTGVMYLPTPGKPYQEQNITVKGQQLQGMENFNYLGSTLPCSANIDAEVNNSIAKACSAFGRWKKSVWE